jgi:preprotein translocase subunit SecY
MASQPGPVVDHLRRYRFADPVELASLLSDRQNGWWMLIVILIILVLTIFAIVFVQQGRRNVPVLFPGRRMGNRMSMPVRSNLPLMVNMAGMIPLIFAQAILTFPAIVASYFVNSGTDGWLKLRLAYLHHLWRSGRLVRPVLLPDGGGCSPSSTRMCSLPSRTTAITSSARARRSPVWCAVRPTQKYLTKVQRRITLPGALFLGFVAVLPFILQPVFPASARAACS